LTAESIGEQIVKAVPTLEELYHKLVLVAGPAGSGKTAALRYVSTQLGATVLNVNLKLSERLLDLTDKERALELANTLAELLGSESGVALLDNTEILFDVRYHVDPLKLLQSLSRNRTVVATWNGTVSKEHLVYAIPGHPEYRRYPRRDLVIIVAGEESAPAIENGLDAIQ
jgi:ABC-type cobalamin/Fe3+-siderophores transport system ATPase subunit